MCRPSGKMRRCDSRYSCWWPRLVSPLRQRAGGTRLRTVADKVREVEAVVARGPFAPAWTSPREVPDTRLVPRRQVRHLHPLGPLLRARLRQRVVSAQHVPEGRQGRSSTTSPPTARNREFGYKDFIPQFKAEKFDAASGPSCSRTPAQATSIPVAEHHDGFPMYDSDLTEWSAAKMGPKRDVIGELADAFRAEGLDLRRLVPPRRALVVLRPGHDFDSDVRDRRSTAFYGPATNQRTSEDQSEPPDQAFLDDWLLRSCEIVDKYQPQVVYFDWWIASPCSSRTCSGSPPTTTTAAPSGARPSRSTSRRRAASFPDGTGVFDIERGQSAAIRPDFWQTYTGVSKNSWGYVTNHDYKSRSHRRRPDRHRQQERQAAAQHRPPARRHHPGSEAGDAPRDRRWLPSTAKRSTARGPGRSSAKGPPRSSPARSPT